MHRIIQAEDKTQLTTINDFLQTKTPNLQSYVMKRTSVTRKQKYVVNNVFSFITLERFLT